MRAALLPCLQAFLSTLHGQAASLTRWRHHLISFGPPSWEGAVRSPSVMLRFREVKQPLKVTQDWLEAEVVPRSVRVSDPCSSHWITLPENAPGFTPQQRNRGFIVPDLFFPFFAQSFSDCWMDLFMTVLSHPLNVKSKTLFHPLPSFSPLSLPWKKFYQSLFKTI